MQNSNTVWSLDFEALKKVWSNTTHFMLKYHTCSFVLPSNNLKCERHGESTKYKNKNDNFLTIITCIVNLLSQLWVTKVRFGLDWKWRLRFVCVFLFFFFFLLLQLQLLTKSAVDSASVYYLRIHKFRFSTTFFIKNGFHVTIYTFKNYFAIVFSISIFNFSKNKLNSNRPKI